MQSIRASVTMGIVVHLAIFFMYLTSIPIRICALRHHRSLLRPVTRSMMSTSPQEPKKRVLCLDFDGVVCASSPESSVTAIQAARGQWVRGNILAGACDISDDEEPVVREAIQALRPWIETGYENIILARMCLEDLRAGSGLKEINTTEILEKWTPEKRDAAMVTWRTNAQELMNVFANTRDALIAADFESWISLNKCFEPVQV